MDRVLGWNVRGLNSIQKQNEVNHFIQKYAVGLVGLLEHKVKLSNLGKLYQKVFVNWCFTSNSSYHSGGRIVVAWKAGCFTVNIVAASSQFVHCHVTPVSGRKPFYCTFVYAFTDAGMRQDLWRDLLLFNTQEPWIVCGDFNCVMALDQRIGALVRHRDIVDVSNCMHACGMEDIKCVGNLFTWNNKQQGNNRVFSKIDRYMANQACQTCFPVAEVCFMPEGIFDHSPGLLSVFPRDDGGKKPFKYFTMWKSSNVFSDIVQQAWNTQFIGTKMFILINKLKRVKLALKELNKVGFTDIQAADLRAYQTMVSAQTAMHNNPSDQSFADAELIAIQEYKEKHNAYLAFLSQKAKLARLKDGDENTSLFHQSSTSDNRTPVNKEVVQQGPVCLDHHKAILNAPYTADEVKKALFSIQGIKAPGPDGFGSYFYKDAWHIVGDEVIAAILDMLQQGRILKEVNHTVITLIPKTKCPKDVSEFRPISCCNTIYKCITKVLCGRLRQVLPDLIMENQGGFVHGRYIVHNIMVVQDLVRHCGRKGVKPSCLMKIDLQKAYDTVDWQFLQEMLVLLDFPKHFVDMVMQCVTTPMFSLMLNGSMHGFFKSKRGLRQGDPISPQLFVICMEYLSRILNRVSSMHQFQFHLRCKGIGLTHLCFADDLIICSKGDYQSIYLFLQAFKLFSDTSGLKANPQKSSIYCHGMHESDIQRVVDVSGFSRSMLTFKYLGVPICSKKISVAQCAHLVDKMITRIKIWSSRNLSYTARMQLVNSVLLSLHMYWAQIYVLPKGVLQDIVKICIAFLWSGHAFSHKPSNIAWDKVCSDKHTGGLGFRDVQKWNIAFMGKYVWALVKKQDNVWIRWINSVYLKDGDWWEYQPWSTASWYWKQVCNTKEQVKQFFTCADFENMPYYSVKQVYEKLLGDKPRVHWDKMVWNRLNVPKHRFICWLAVQSKLQTTDKLAKIGISQSASCLICGLDDETHQHFFFQCQYSKQIIIAVHQWIGFSIHGNLVQLVRKAGQIKASKFRKQVYFAAVGAAVYLIWRCRNTSFWDNSIPTVSQSMKDLKQMVKSRIQVVLPKHVSKRDSEWFTNL
ncbi:uncharacterized protein [Spinacia oleracea]|uniref:Reverse transcriptase domain-containing protein n=1 Tax=Spinacia oleracea TaxID=3562 RepID=A0A9R0JHB0_SPIOL|nr:uncharacterized protein LOC110774822 [Spinacia oleracea]